jgi:hypothetical protein
MLWQEWPFPRAELNDDTVVTTTIGKLTAALAEALKAVNVVDEPQWKPGDRACIEVEVTGVHGPNGEHVNYVIAGLTGKRRGGSVPADILEGFEE